MGLEDLKTTLFSVVSVPSVVKYPKDLTYKTGVFTTGRLARQSPATKVFQT